MADDKITCTASSRAVVVLTGLLGLRKSRPGEPACSIEEGGNAIWRLRHGIVVTLELADDGAAHWHLGHDNDPAPRDSVASVSPAANSPQTPDQPKET